MTAQQTSEWPTAQPADAAKLNEARIMIGESVPRLLGFVVIGLGAVVVLGWALESDLLKSVIGGVTMKANEAASFVLLGIALILHSPSSTRSRSVERAAVSMVWAVLLIAGLALAGFALQWDLGIDEVLFTDAASTSEDPGRMSPITAGSFVLLGLSMLLGRRPSRPAVGFAQTSIFIVVLVSMAFLMLYGFGLEAPLEYSDLASVSVHSALGLMLVAIAQAWRSRNRGVLSEVLRDTPGALLLRRIAIPCTLGLVAIARIRLEGERAGWYGDEIGVAIMVGSALAIVVAFTIIASRAIDRRMGQIEGLARDLRRSNLDLEHFAHAASHDLAEPLRMVTSYMDLLERRYADRLDEDAREFIGFATDGASRMQGLLDGLLTYSRVGGAKKNFRYIETDAIVDAALMDLDVKIKDKGAHISRGSLPVVNGDPVQLSQLFQNLMTNALKFTPAGTAKVEIGADGEGKMHRFWVRDNGIGIDPRFSDKVFLIFERLHGVGEYPGTGLGLALCKKIVERHGGRIWVESESGAGATFLFTLPGKETQYER